MMRMLLADMKDIDREIDRIDNPGHAGPQLDAEKVFSIVKDIWEALKRGQIEE
jgi:hypothetical protein